MIHEAYGGGLKHECGVNGLDFGAHACCPCLGTVFNTFQRVCPAGSERSFRSFIDVLLVAGLTPRPFGSVEPFHRISRAGRLPLRSVSAKTPKISRCRGRQTPRGMIPKSGYRFSKKFVPQP